MAFEDAQARLLNLIGSSEREVAAYVHRKVPREDTADVLQDTWLRTYLALSRRPISIEGDAGLLWTVVRRAVADYWRRAPVRASAGAERDDAQEAQDLEAGVLSDRLRDAVQDILQTLPAAYRTVLFARLVEGLPLAQIASVLSLPEGTVKSRLHQGRRLLQERLATWRSPALCAELRAAPLGLGWGLRSLGSPALVAAHLATCAGCQTQWQHLEHLMAGTDALSAGEDALLRTCLRIEQDLSVWVEGDVTPSQRIAPQMTFATASEFGRPARVMDERERNRSAEMRIVPGGGEIPDRYALAPPGAAIGSGRMRFVHRISAEQATDIAGVRRIARGAELRYRNVPTYDPDLRVRTAVFVSLPPGARLQVSHPGPVETASSFGRRWLSFVAVLGGGELQSLTVRFRLA